MTTNLQQEIEQALAASVRRPDYEAGMSKLARAPLTAAATKRRAVQFKLRAFMKDRVPVNIHRPDSVHLYHLVETDAQNLYEMLFFAEEVFDSITNRPIWIIKFSGGKDSTAVYCAAVEYLIRRPQLNIRLVVIRNETLMDAPQLIAQAELITEYGQALCDAHGIRHDVVITKPRMDDRYWVMTLGHGYPPFNRDFRPCTSAMKTKPSELVMVDVLESLGAEGAQMAVLMGVRTAESKDRAERYADSDGKGGKKFNKDACIRGEGECGQLTADGTAFSEDIAQKGVIDVYPILHARTCTVFDSITFVFADLNWPTGVLADIYGEEDTRFGCWMCSLVPRVRDIENLAQVPGNEWLDKLLAFRADYLAEALLDANRLHVVHEPGRLIKKGKNKGKERKAGTQKTGLTMAFRERWLSRLLDLDAEIRETTGYILIEEEEVNHIRHLWERERRTGKRGKAGRGLGHELNHKQTPKEA